MRFTTAKVQDAHAYFICTGLVVTVSNYILPRISFGVIDTGVSSIPKMPADTRRFTVIIMLRKSLEISQQRIGTGGSQSFKVGSAGVGSADQDIFAPVCFAPTKIEDVHTHFIGTGLVVIVNYHILSCEGLRVVDTGIPSVTKSPADTRRFAVIIMLGQCSEVGS